MIVTPDQVIAFSLIIARIGGVLQLAPVFNSKEIFAMAKLAMAFWIATLIMFVIPLPPHMPQGVVLFALAIITELLIGAMMGFAMQLFVIGIEFAGELMDTQAGMSAASALDPSSGNNTTILSRLTRWISIVIFLIIGGHHVVLSALYQSFVLCPIGSPINFAGGTQLLMQLGGAIFGVAIQIAAPILLVMLLMDFGFGMLSKIAPQVNVFQLSFQVKPIVAVFVLLTVSAGMVGIIYGLLEKITTLLLELMMAIQIK